MQYLILGIDGTDKEAMDRRLAVREQHIALGDELLKLGNMWYGAALLNKDGSMRGSALMMYFKNREELDSWLEKEPYVVGNVWQDIQILECNTRDPWQFNRSQEWFEEFVGIKG